MLASLREGVLHSFQGCRRREVCLGGLAHAAWRPPVPSASSPRAEPTAQGGVAHLLADGEGVSVW